MTTWADVPALNVWVNLRSRFSWFADMAIAAVLAIQMMAPQWQQDRQSVGKAIGLIFIML